MDIEWMGRVCLAHAARRTANLVTRHYNRYLAPLGLEVTQAVLLGVIGSGKAESLSALARLMGIERSTLQRNLLPLEQADLVRRNKRGPKQVVPELTALGEERLAEAYEAWQLAQNSLTDTLDDPDADAIRAHLSALRKAVRHLETPNITECPLEKANRDTSVMSDTQTTDSLANLGALPRDIIAGMSGVEIFEAMLAGRLPAPPIMVTMEMKLREAERGRAVFTGTPSAAHMNPQGTVHGGWISTILDSALTCAVHTDLEAGELCTTTSLTVNMVRPLMPGAGETRCEGRVVHRGRRLATAEGSLLDANGKLIAHGTANCMIFGIGQ